MNATRHLPLAFAASLMLAACGGGGNGPAVVPAVTDAVPAEASTSPAAATQYVTELSAVDMAFANSLEPVSPIPDTLATDDTAEPRRLD